MRDALGRVQSALLLGGTSDIGLALMRALVAGHCERIVLAARNPDSLSSATDDLKRRGTSVSVAAFDALQTVSHRSVLDEVFSQGDIDLACVAFGVLGSQDTFDRDHEAAVDAVTANYTGAVSVGLLLAEHMKRQGHGTIVFLSSVAGIRARASNFVYGSSKAGMDAFAQGLGDSLKGTGVDVLVVRPGFVLSKMTNGLKTQPFTTTPDAVAADIIRGLECGKETVWSPGILRYIFTGMRHLPRPLWRFVSSRA